jgi:hypothetical protein
VQQPPLPQSAPVPVHVAPSYTGTPLVGHDGSPLPAPSQVQQQSYSPPASAWPEQMRPEPIRPEPVRHEQGAAEQADLARMLSDALDHADDTHGEASTQVWSAPGDVRIQPGLAPMVGQKQAVPATGHDIAQHAAPHQNSGHEPFRPMPPQDPKRAAAKRMPDLEEFPLVAQREYREHQARTQANGAPNSQQPSASSFHVPVQQPMQHPMPMPGYSTGQPPSQYGSQPHVAANQVPGPNQVSGPRIYTPPPTQSPVPARKPGLFERLTGKGRKSIESFDSGANHTHAPSQTQRGPVSTQMNAAQPTLQVVINEAAADGRNRQQRTDNK